MIALNILDHRLFMQQLLKGSIFYPFEVRNAEVQTFASFQISGQLHKDFFLLDEQDLLTSHYALWKDIQPFIFQVIKGSRLPGKLKIILSLPKNQWKIFLPTDNQQASAFFLNILYENHKMTCTTGVALSSFTLDKSLEHAWDEYILHFLKENQIHTEKAL
ncbi:MAG: hypothetical protein GX347_00700 [Epulopiscium sp.]|nr:hypothetical protein [Candidatus Epulonipiscium sp.]